ncbi:MAG: hypothetical protein FWD48_12100 [Oscillospiraceae bacterium]|nr:hypothetical protein [Oscillospiraceae bacterium]
MKKLLVFILIITIISLFYAYNEYNILQEGSDETFSNPQITTTALITTTTLVTTTIPITTTVPVTTTAPITTTTNTFTTTTPIVTTTIPITTTAAVTTTITVTTTAPVITTTATIITTARTQSERGVFVTRTGTKYHYINPCGNGTYFEITLASAIISYDPCAKCVL